MKRPLLLICDRRRRLVDLLRRCDPDPIWRVQHVTDPLNVRDALREPMQGVCVIVLEENPVPGLQLLLWLERWRSQVVRVAVLDSADREVETLCWDSGATLVMGIGKRRSLPGILRRLSL